MIYDQLGPLRLLISEKKEGSFRNSPEKVWQFLQQAAWLSEGRKATHLSLEHQTGVFPAGQDAFQVLKADAVFTEEKAKSAVLSLTVGDCFPLVFFDQKTENFALIHVSRKTLFLGILQKTLQKLTNQSVLTRVRASDILVWIGPGIQADSYLFSPLPEELQLPFWQKYLKKQQDSWQLDLQYAIACELFNLGIAQNQQHFLALDTYGSANFFSHRRSVMTGEPEGRFLVAVAWAA